MYMYAGESVSELCEQTVCTVGIGGRDLICIPTFPRDQGEVLRRFPRLSTQNRESERMDLSPSLSREKSKQGRNV